MAKKRTQKDKEREKIKDGEPKGISGLYNLGNSCYLNSILQCLLHLPEFIIYMNSPKLRDDLEYNKKINKILSNSEQQKLEFHYKLLKEFEKLLKDIWKGIPIDDLLNLLNTKNNSNNDNNNQIEHEEEKSNKNNIIISNNNKYILDPTDFKKILSEIFPQFAGTYQQDAHEVLTSILDSFHLALNKTINESGLLIAASSFDQNLLVRKTLSCLADASHRAVNDSFIDDTFFGQLSSIFSCYKCHKKLNETYEPFSTLALTIPIEKNINLYILPLNPKNHEQIKLNIIINDNMSYEDLYNQINKITGYNFENYIFYWPNDAKKKNGNIKKRNLRSSKNNNNENINMKNKFNMYENEDIIINESNIDKCQNYISFKTNELIIMENYGINQVTKNNKDRYSIYEYNLEIKILKNNKSNNNINYNNLDNIPRIFKVHLLENEDEHLIYNHIYKYLELFAEKEKINKKRSNKSENNNLSGKKKLSNSSSGKNKNKKQNSKKEAKSLILDEVNEVKEIEIESACKTYINNNCITLEEEKEIICENKYILGVICKNVPNENNNNYTEQICPLCNKKSKKISDENVECFCINDIFDNELMVKKDYRKIFSTKLINFIENNIYPQDPLLSIRIHPYQKFSLVNFNKFTMYTVTINAPKSKKKIVHQQNLMELFESFAAEEKIENYCLCDKCGYITYTYQKKDIHKFPQILIIHIKRFKNEIEKNEEKIEFPEEIDLSKYNNKGLIGKYSLNSAVFHQGTLISGHYTAILKYIPTSQWLFCNDTKVRVLTGDKIMGLNPAYNKDDVAAVGDGYILFYRKKD